MEDEGKKRKRLGEAFQYEEGKKEKKREEEKGKRNSSFSCCVNSFAFLDGGLVSLDFVSRLLL